MIKAYRNGAGVDVSILSRLDPETPALLGPLVAFGLKRKFLDIPSHAY